MLSAYESQERAVRTLMREIRELDASRKTLVTQNPEKSDSLTREIFRKCGIMDVVRVVEFVAGRPVRIMDDVVSALKHEVHAEPEDFEMLPGNFPNEVPTPGNPPRFPHIAMLPALVKKHHVFSQITDVLDKRIVTNVFPNNALMMGWKSEILNLEAVIPMILEQTSIQPVDIINLCNSNGRLHDALLTKFKETLLGSAYLFPSTEVKELIGLSNAGIPNGQLPVTLCVHLFEWLEPTGGPDLLEQLSHIGATILDSLIVIDLHEEAFENLDRLGKVLREMPNLHRLKIFGCISRDFDTIDVSSTLCQELMQMSNLVLPPLHRLQSLLVCPSTNADDAFWQKIVSAYGPQLRFFGDMGIFRHKLGQTDTSFSSTTAYSIEYNLMLREMKTMLNEAPLTGFEIINSHYHVSEMLLVISAFGKTLKSLTFGVGIDYDRHVSPRTGAQDESWMVQVQFPDVKTLCIGCIVPFWEILLLFPSLESLVIYNVTHPTEDSFSKTDMFVLSWEKRSMMASKLWKYLQNLATIEIHKRDPANDQFEIISLSRVDA